MPTRPNPASSFISSDIPDTTKNSSIMGGVNLSTWRNSFLSWVRLMYTAPNTMQLSRGDTSKMVHSPESAKSSAVVRMSRLSRLRLGVISRLSTRPNNPPATKKTRLYKMGSSIPFQEKLPVSLPLTLAATMEKTNRQTTSSRATTCKRVLTNSPLARY